MKIHNFFTLDQRCPLCKKVNHISETKGAIKIRKFLQESDISFIQEKRFQDCKNIDGTHALSFDFYLPDRNIIIEYDGQQHFDIKSFNQTEEEFSRRQENDNIKNDYCNKNKIKLIRIPYNKYTTINKILKEELLIN